MAKKKTLDAPPVPAAAAGLSADTMSTTDTVMDVATTVASGTPGTVAPAPTPAKTRQEGAGVPGVRFDSPKDEIKYLRARIAVDTARLEQLERRQRFVEFPKMLTRGGETRTFKSREEQDAAGAAWADAEAK